MALFFFNITSYVLVNFLKLEKFLIIFSKLIWNRRIVHIRGGEKSWENWNILIRELFDKEDNPANEEIFELNCRRK